MRLLRIDSCARAGSVTRRLTAKFAEEWMTKESMQMATCNHPSDLGHRIARSDVTAPKLSIPICMFVTPIDPWTHQCASCDSVRRETPATVRSRSTEKAPAPWIIR